MRIVVTCGLIVSLATAGQAAESVPYKGRVIQMGDTPAAAQCLEHVRRGIDMVDGLPAHLKALGHAVRDLKCDPPRGSAEFRDNVVGVYTMLSKTEARGIIDFRRNPAFLAPVHYALSMVTNGIYAGWHRAYVEASRQAARDPAARDKANRLETILSKGDLGAVVRAECTILSTTRETLQALDMDERQIAAVGRTLRERNC